MTRNINNDLWNILESLADRFCERRAYKCLLHLLRAYFAPNGLTDGWADCREALRDTRALCRDDLKEEDLKDINRAIAFIDDMLLNR